MLKSIGVVDLMVTPKVVSDGNVPMDYLHFFFAGTLECDLNTLKSLVRGVVDSIK